jgi:biotin operon repressor
LNSEADNLQISRLFETVYLLLNKKSMTANELAEHFEVSKRTILRDIDRLSAAGIPVYTTQGKGGGISILDNFVLNKAAISDEEQNQILLALQSLSATQYVNGDELLSKLGALFDKSDSAWIEVDFSRWGNTEPDLMRAATGQFEKMWKLINGITEEGQLAPFTFELTKSMKEAHWTRDKNLRDVLVHLYEWHQLLLNWFDANQNGAALPFLPEPYNWKTYGDMNLEFWRKHQATSYKDSKKLLCDSHQRVMGIIEGLSNEELFEAGVLPWTATSVFGAYCVSVTASHYDWAMKKIKAHIKTAASRS